MFHNVYQDNLNRYCPWVSSVPFATREGADNGCVRVTDKLQFTRVGRVRVMSRG